MMDLPSDLGARIRRVAQMAVTAHWQLVLADQARVTDDTPATGQLNPDQQRQRENVGGTGASQVTEDQLPSRCTAARSLRLRAARR